MNTLKRQAKKSNISALDGIAPPVTEREVVLAEPTAAPVQGKKRGRSTKAPHSEV